MGIREIKQELNNFEKDKLVSMLVDLYKKNKFVKEYLNHFVNLDENKIFELYKSKLCEELYPSTHRKYNLSKAQSVLSEFKKFNPSPEYKAEIHLYYVEIAIQFVVEKYYFCDRLAENMEKKFEEAYKIIQKEHLPYDNFAKKVEEILSKSHDLGWNIDKKLMKIHDNYLEIRK